MIRARPCQSPWASPWVGEVEGVEERTVEPPVTAQGSHSPRDRLVRLGAGDPRSRDRWRLLDATDPQGWRRTMLISLL